MGNAGERKKIGSSPEPVLPQPPEKGMDRRDRRSYRAQAQPSRSRQTG